MGVFFAPGLALGEGNWEGGERLRGAPGATKINVLGEKPAKGPAERPGRVPGALIFQNSFVWRSPRAPPSSLCPPSGAAPGSAAGGGSQRGLGSSGIPPRSPQIPPPTRSELREALAVSARKLGQKKFIQMSSELDGKRSRRAPRLEQKYSPRSPGLKNSSPPKIPRFGQKIPPKSSKVEQIIHPRIPKIGPKNTLKGR